MCGLFQVTNRKLFINEILRWPPVAILYIKNARVLTRHLMGGAHMMLNAEHGANRIIRLEVIRFFVNFT